MTVRFYVMPAEVVVVNGRNIRRPSFLTAINPAAAWGWMPVKDEWAIGWADLSTTEHATYNGSVGVLFLTADLSANLSAGAVVAVQTQLATRNLPSVWVDTTDTWAQVIKRTLSFVMCIQRFWGETQQSLNAGRPVTTLVSTLSQSVRDRLAAVSATLDLPAIQAGDTIETMMMRWADTLITRPIFISGVEL